MHTHAYEINIALRKGFGERKFGIAKEKVDPFESLAKETFRLARIQYYDERYYFYVLFSGGVVATSLLPGVRGSEHLYVDLVGGPGVFRHQHLHTVMVHTGV